MPSSSPLGLLYCLLKCQAVTLYRDKIQQADTRITSMYSPAFLPVFLSYNFLFIGLRQLSP